MIGKVLVISTFVFSLLSVIFYAFSFFQGKSLKKSSANDEALSLNKEEADGSINKNVGEVKIKGHWATQYGGFAYYLVTIGVLAISLFLLSNIVSHNFQYTYVWEYSSVELPANLLVSTFYAGQQGSILLWGLMLTLIGFFMLPYVKKHNYEAPVMMIFVSIISFILLMLIFKSPFDYVWETYASEGIKVGFMPKNGRGLNPILQNYWISIHPPILFFGYSLMTVPYVFALAGVGLKDYRKWITLSLPWALFGGGVLGLGLMLGGFWAYETLGWGGFWAWDPVENSSLMPWLLVVSLIHTMLVSRKNGGLIKTNYVLASLAFLFVLYASFLTRSGVLGDTSVHSFVSPGPVIYKLLLSFMIIYTVIALVVFIVRYRTFPLGASEIEINSKEFLLSVGSIILIAIFFVVFMGTSWPIFTEIFGITKSSIDPSWYNSINLPLAALMMAVNSLSLYMLWKRTDYTLFVKKFATLVFLSAGLSVLAFLLGVTKFEYLLLLFTSILGLFANIDFIYRSLKFGFKTSGGFISHTGLALFLMGALASGGYSVNETMKLQEGQTKEALGYKITHKGKFQIEKHWKDREKYKYKIEVEKGGKSTTVYPVVYFSDFNERQSPFFEPGISTELFQDVYVSPYSLENEFPEPPIILKKGENSVVKLDTNYTISLLKFDMSQAMAAQKEDKMLTIASVVRISSKDFVAEDTLYNIMDPASGMSIPMWKNLAKSDLEIGFIQLVPDKENLSNSKAIFVAKPKGKILSKPIETFVFDISTKPFILVVWFGTFVTVFGFILSIFKYLGKNNMRKKEPIKSLENQSASVKEPLKEQLVTVRQIQ